MSDAPKTSAPIQQEALQTAKPVSESLAFALGGAINQCLANTDKVGDIKWSDLTEAAFQGQHDTTWILSDGRSVVGSQYQTLTGLANVPDRRGRFLRGKDNGAGVDTHGDLPIGTAVADQNASHSHGVTDPQHAHAIPTVQNNTTGSQVATANGGQVGTGATGANATGISIQASGGGESNPRYSVANCFVKINP